MISTLARWSVIVTLIVGGVAACGDDEPDPAASGDPCAVASASPAPSASADPAASPDPCAPAPDQDDVNPDEEQFVTDVEADTLDCEADDRTKREVPDCGFYVGRTFVWWGWAAAGKSKPPTGWDYRAEARRAYASLRPAAPPSAPPAVSRPRPAAPPPVAVPAPARTQATTPATTTTSKRKVGKKP